MVEMVLSSASSAPASYLSFFFFVAPGPTGLGVRIPPAESLTNVALKCNEL